jgi:cellulose synthase/poly-beta-1,6-N-acetylglucosamine synthase-like glycosyltransferase
MVITRDRLVALLTEYGIEDKTVLKNADVRAESLIFELNRLKISVPEPFFKALAEAQHLVFIPKEQILSKSYLASGLPYAVMKENLTFLLKFSRGGAEFVTANPLNTTFFTKLENIFRVPITIRVTSTDAIEEAIDRGYAELHTHRALEELRERAPDESAYGVLYPWQQYSIIVVLVAYLLLFIVNYPLSLILLFGVINVVYFGLNLFKFGLSALGFQGSRSEVTIRTEDIEKLDDSAFPVFTIFVPVYREAEMLPHLMKNLHRLDYPKDKLDIKILMEEKDDETPGAARRLGLFGEPETIMESMSSDEYREFLRPFEPIIVPDADIHTKPRACNYGLQRARGEFCVIFDAEDDPDPDQLKKAVLAFSHVDLDCVCLQSRLNFYNPKDNLLTRWFTLEYSYHYDFYLHGVDRIGAPIPLGGTSNYFRTKAIRDLGGWDPYNVTEDADLGIRIARKKLRTSMLNSYTYEEANTKVWNWIRQRSRWIKGYIQTYLVHMRHPRKLRADLGWRKFALFQLTLGSSIFVVLVNPILWLTTALTILTPAIFPFSLVDPLFYVCLFNLVVGNAFFLTTQVIAAAKERKYSLIPFALLVPIYWALISFAGWKGAIQLLTKPFYWEKTRHGISKSSLQGRLPVKIRKHTAF